MNRGEVVEVDWPFSDRTGSKTRPAVVVQADFLNGLIDDSVLVQITSTRYGLPGTEVVIDPSKEPASGLSRVCYASCTNVLTLDQALVLGMVGVLSDALLHQIEACLKTVLQIRQSPRKCLGPAASGIVYTLAETVPDTVRFRRIASVTGYPALVVAGKMGSGRSWPGRRRGRLRLPGGSDRAAGRPGRRGRS